MSITTRGTVHTEPGIAPVLVTALADLETHASGSITTAGTSVTIDGRGVNILRAVLTAITATTGSAAFQGSVDNVHWSSLLGFFGGGPSISQPLTIAGGAVVGTEYISQVSGYPYLRLYSAAGTDGSITVEMSASRNAYEYGLAREGTLKTISDSLDTGTSISSTTAAASASTAANTALYTTALEYDGSNNPIYVGHTLQGSLKSALAWQIRKLTFDGSNNLTDIKFANGSLNFDMIWDNRATFTYS